MGNGELCFGVDGTGLQTFAGNTMAHWAWHNYPTPPGLHPAYLLSTGTYQRGRNSGGDHFPPGTDDIRTWLWDNPHKMNLCRLRLVHTGGDGLRPEEITGLARTLDLWTGVQTSDYMIAGRPVHVETCVHPDLDVLAVRIVSSLVASGEIEVGLDFPYPSLENGPWVGDFFRASAHSTRIARRTKQSLELERTIDASSYRVRIDAGEGCAIQECDQVALQTSGRTDSCHAYRASAAGAESITLACAFSPAALPAGSISFDTTKRASAAGWAGFWRSGGVVDFSDSRDPRWKELERRVVLSQYTMAAQNAGSWPSAETGLLGLDPWRGQFHMEMIWWHLAHYALWNRWELGEEAIGCYRRFVPAARELAEQLGYEGLKWPKSVGPEGRSAPWYGNHVLLWKQPHPIFFAELEWRLRPTRATLDKWLPIVQGTAEHMADYPIRNKETGLFSLDPCMPPCEQGITRDGVFDLAYWRWGLDKAQEWRERSGLTREKHWDELRKNLAPLPVKDGVFVHSAEWADTYTERAWEHPDPIGVFGMLPPIEGVGRETAHRTVLEVWKTWDWNKCWGWDFPWMAMAAARTGEPGIAVEALLMESERNGYDEAGINTGGPCPYLPGNGGLLYAVAMMTAGWDGAPGCDTPGFPQDRTWKVRWENLNPAP